MTTSPERLGKYLIHEEIGRGGFGTVYRATDTTLDRVVALKILDPLLTRDPGFLERFRREAVGAARLEHPNIVPVYEVGQAEARSFIAMKYVPGRSLDRLLAEGRLPIERTLHILAQVAAALDFAHSKGLIHRDIKPSNILVGPDEASGDPDHATLTDFGLARASDQSIMTSLGQALGTPAYMAPEQLDVDRQAEVGPASDIYSFAVVAYEMLAGRPPFVGPTPAVMAAHLTKTPLPVTQFNADLPPTLWNALAPGLVKDTTTRPASVALLVKALSRACEMADRERAEIEARAKAEAEAAANARAAAEAQAAAQAAARRAEEERLQRVRAEVAARRAEEERQQREQTEAAARRTAWEQEVRRQQLERDFSAQRGNATGTSQRRIPVWVILGATGVILVGIMSMLLAGPLGAKPTPVVVEKIMTQVVEKEVKVVETLIVEKIVRVTEARPTATATSLPISTPTSSLTPVISINPTAKRILFDTTHREWGVRYGDDDRNIVETLGYQIDMLSLSSFENIDIITAYADPKETVNFSFSTSNDYPILAIWLLEGPFNVNVSLKSGERTLSALLWSPDNPYIHPALFQNMPGSWAGSFTIDDVDWAKGNYRLQVAGLKAAPIRFDVLAQYSMIWLHNPFNPFLPQEQSDLVKYVRAGGTVLIVANEDSDLSFQFLLAEPYDSLSFTNGEVKRYYRGDGRIAWFNPAGSNPNLYRDSGNEKEILSQAEVGQTLDWLETGSQ